MADAILQSNKQNPPVSDFFLITLSQLYLKIDPSGSKRSTSQNKLSWMPKGTNFIPLGQKSNVYSIFTGNIQISLIFD